MSAMVKMTGLKELIQQLTDAPEDIRAEGIGIVREETEGCAIETVQAYPRATGILAARVKTSYPASDLLVGIVQSTAPHSHLYEFGTPGVRKYTGTDKRGRRYTDASRGIMPKAGIIVPIAQRRRALMFERLKDMMIRRGYTVSE